MAFNTFATYPIPDITGCVTGRFKTSQWFMMSYIPGMILVKRFPFIL